MQLAGLARANERLKYHLDQMLVAGHLSEDDDAVARSVKLGGGPEDMLLELRLVFFVTDLVEGVDQCVSKIVLGCAVDNFLSGGIRLREESRPRVVELNAELVEAFGARFHQIALAQPEMVLLEKIVYQSQDCLDTKLISEELLRLVEKCHRDATQTFLGDLIHGFLRDDWHVHQMRDDFGGVDDFRIVLFDHGPNVQLIQINDGLFFDFFVFIFFNAFEPAVFVVLRSGELAQL